MTLAASPIIISNKPQIQRNRRILLSGTAATGFGQMEALILVRFVVNVGTLD